MLPRSRGVSCCRRRRRRVVRRQLGHRCRTRRGAALGPVGDRIIGSPAVPVGTVVAVDAAYFVAALAPIEVDLSGSATVTLANADATAPTQAMTAAGAIGTAGEVPPDHGIHVSGHAGAAAVGFQALSAFQTWSLGVPSCGPSLWQGVARTVQELEEITRASAPRRGRQDERRVDGSDAASGSPMRWPTTPRSGAPRGVRRTRRERPRRRRSVRRTGQASDRRGAGCHGCPRPPRASATRTHRQHLRHRRLRRRRRLARLQKQRGAPWLSPLRHRGHRWRTGARPCLASPCTVLRPVGAVRHQRAVRQLPEGSCSGLFGKGKHFPAATSAFDLRCLSRWRCTESSKAARCCLNARAGNGCPRSQ